MTKADKTLGPIPVAMHSPGTEGAMARPGDSPLAAGDRDGEIAALIATLNESAQRLEILTNGQVDSVADQDGRMFLLRHAQENLRHGEAARQAAILNALPANIALIDDQGVIVSVNDAWRRFAGVNVLQTPGYAIGINYLEVCAGAQGDDSAGAHEVAQGIRSVLCGRQEAFSIEYACHSPTGERWFLCLVTPLADGKLKGAVVMHMDITERKRSELEITRMNQGLRTSEIRIRYLNRVHAVLSGINTLIVRVRDREELFQDACRIAVEQGGFHICLLGMLDRGSMKIVPVAMAGDDAELVATIKSVLSSDALPNTVATMAISEKKAVISNDAQNDPRILLGKIYVETGVRSLAYFPLIVSGEAVGVLGLYADEIEFFQPEEIDLLNELSGDIAFAIDHIEKAEKLSYLACYDELTGLPNRDLFLDRVIQCMRSAAHVGRQLAVLLFDIERFKSINDSLGRAAGDALLKQVADWLIRETEDANLLARLGADHFAVVLPDAKPDGDVARFLEKTMAALANHPFNLGDALFRITIKAGVALFPDDGDSVDTLFQHAEAALKKAKAGGDRYLFFSKAMSDKVAGKLTLENKLRLAIDNEEFVLHYQPKVNLVSGKLTSAEALIRWNDPTSGLVAPYLFIPILEETGLIRDVGRWVLRKAVADYLRWRDTGLPAVRIAVNVSELQLRDHGFVDEIRQVIGADARASAGLELEITESMIMEDVRQAIDSLQAIRAMGVPVAIDDFGTGFSSLSYLSKLPIDTLKIDRSFVIDSTASADGLALVSAIISLAHALQLKVVAEGVETEEQRRLLQLLRCDEMQGYLFSKPVPADIFETRFLAAQVVR